MRSSNEEYDSAISGSIEPPISSNARFSFASGVSGVVTINHSTSFLLGPCLRFRRDCLYEQMVNPLPGVIALSPWKMLTILNTLIIGNKLQHVTKCHINSLLFSTSIIQ